MGKATHVTEKSEAFKIRTLALGAVVAADQWRPVVAPVLCCGFWPPSSRSFSCNPSTWPSTSCTPTPPCRRPSCTGFPLEYPAPALVVFMLPLLLGFSYPWAFAVVAGIVLVLLVTSYQTSGVEGMDTEAARRLIVYLAVGAVILVTGRYDIFAVAAAFWSVRAARQDRWSAAWTWSCIGFVIKLFPAIFWPALPDRRVASQRAATGSAAGLDGRLGSWSWPGSRRCSTIRPF